MGRPAFIVIGAQKSGTTSLFIWLRSHPAVQLSSPKEVHFFDQHFSRGMDWYGQHFSGPCAGEMTPYYLFHPLAAERAAATVPEVKVIAMLREPVSRAYSHYHHVRRQGAEPLPFADALELESLRLRGEEDKIRADPRYTSLHHQKYSYLSRGMYATQLARWLERFPQQQLLVLETAHLRADPQGALDTFSAFLGVPSVRMRAFPRFNTGGAYPPMAPHLREQLQALYAPHNAALVALLGERAPAFAHAAAA